MVDAKVEIEASAVGVGQAIASRCLPQAGEAGAEAEDFFGGGAVIFS